MLQAEDVQDLEIEADVDLDECVEDEEESLDQFDADKMMAVDEVGGSEDEEEGNETLQEEETKPQEEEDMEILTAEEEESLLKEVSSILYIEKYCICALNKLAIWPTLVNIF